MCCSSLSSAKVFFLKYFYVMNGTWGTNVCETGSPVNVYDNWHIYASEIFCSDYCLVLNSMTWKFCKQQLVTAVGSVSWWRYCCICCFLYSRPYPAVVKLPVVSLLELVERTLAVTPRFLVSCLVCKRFSVIILFIWCSGCNNFVVHEANIITCVITGTFNFVADLLFWNYSRSGQVPIWKLLGINKATFYRLDPISVT